MLADKKGSLKEGGSSYQYIHLYYRFVVSTYSTLTPPPPPHTLFKVFLEAYTGEATSVEEKNRILIKIIHPAKKRELHVFNKNSQNKII